MSTFKSKHVWESSVHRGSNLILMLALADNATREGYCWPGHQTLADMARLSKRQSMRLISECIESGELYKHERPGKSNQWVVMLETSLEDFLEVARTNLQIDETEARAIWVKHQDRMAAFQIKRGVKIDTPSKNRGGNSDTPVENITPAREGGVENDSPSKNGGVSDLTSTSDIAASPDPLITKKDISIEKGNVILSALESMTSRDIFNIALRGAKFVKFEEETIFIQPASETAIAWLDGELKPQIINVSKAILEQDIKEVAIWAK
jgi:hypothetical protein